MIHSYDYADDDGDYRLDVAVHTDKRGPDPFLSDRNQKVCDESGQDYQIGKFGILDRRYRRPFNFCKSFHRKGSGNQSGEMA